MKRFFFSLIALAAVATGCTQSAMLETPEHLGTEISFNPYTGRTPETKATQITTADALATAGGFYVYGFLNQEDKGQSVYINDEKVTKGTSGWTYNNVVYWPDASSTSTLDFVAYSANANDKTSKHSGLSKVSKTGFTFTVPDAVNDQVDLLATAYQPGLKYSNSDDGDITLQFHHLLSRIGFKVQANQTSTESDISITSLSFVGTMPTSGTLTFRDAQYTAIPKLNVSSTTSKKTYNFLDAAFTTRTSTSAQITKQITRTDGSNYLMIMPHTATDASINVEYTFGSSTKTATVKLPSDLIFAPGTAYEFILKISTSKIIFDVTETDWNNSGDNESSLIPEDANAISAVANVTGAETADIILTPKKAGLGTIGVEYKKSAESEWEKSQYGSSYTANGNYTISLEGLTSNTTYQYRAYSIKEDVTTYYPSDAQWGTFTTKVNPEEFTVSLHIGDDGISPNSAEVVGAFGGTAETRGFCLIQGTSTPTTDNRNYVCAAGNDFKHTYTELTPATTYTCCAYVIIGGVISYSEPVTFTTAPVVTTEPDNNGDPGDSGDSGTDNPKPPVDSWEGEGDDDNEIDF